jgi:hypothetical protein
MAKVNTKFIDTFVDGLRKDSGSIILTPKEMMELQFGFPLQHFSQQYIFGATGLRIGQWYSISGPKESCKSSLLFDVMGHVCKYLGGIAVLIETEGKIAPELLHGILQTRYGEDILGGQLQVSRYKDKRTGKTYPHTLKTAGDLLFDPKSGIIEKFSGVYDVPLLVGLDSIGGAADEATAKKIESDGAVGKQFADKQHHMKYLSENFALLAGDTPIVIVTINHEATRVGATGISYKTITGGDAQQYKAGHMLSMAVKKTLQSGGGKDLLIKTIKTSFCDARKLEVGFRWNKFNNLEGHRFEWELASAQLLALPDRGFGDLKDIVAVSVSDKGLVTCPQLNCRSVTPEEFEEQLMSSELLPQVQEHMCISRIKGIDEYAQYMKELKRPKDAKKADEEVPKPKRGRKKAQKEPEEEESDDAPFFAEDEEVGTNDES